MLSWRGPARVTESQKQGRKGNIAAGGALKKDCFCHECEGFGQSLEQEGATDNHISQQETQVIKGGCLKRQREDKVRTLQKPMPISTLKSLE